MQEDALNRSIHDDDPFAPADRELERALLSLAPADAGLDRDRLMFEAGRATASPGKAAAGLWKWRGMAAALAMALGASFLWRPAPSVTERATHVPATARPDDRHDPGASSRPAPYSAVDARGWRRAPSYDRPLLPSADADYLALRDAALQLGVGVLPAARGAAHAGADARPPTLEGLLDPPPPPRRPEAPVSPLKRLLTGDFL